MDIYIGAHIYTTIRKSHFTHPQAGYFLHTQKEALRE